VTRSAPPALATSAAARAAQAENDVRRALRDLDREGAAITFAAVSVRAQVSRSFLYRHEAIRNEIARLRGSQIEAPPRLPVRERASDASLRTRLHAGLEANRRQREEIAQLREELALAHGRVRELELERRVRR
jgi:Family of unknown function (DUF6262)